MSNSNQKECKQCKAHKKLSEFYIRYAGTDREWIQSKCKDCENKNSKKFQQTEKRKEWRRKYRAKRKEQEKLQYSAWAITNALINRGDIIRPDKRSQCGSSTRIQAHHEDYLKPLDIMWLCELCHKKIHKKK